jgi:hypothetical protein
MTFEEVRAIALALPVRRNGSALRKSLSAGLVVSRSAEACAVPVQAQGSVVGDTGHTSSALVAHSTTG